MIDLARFTYDQAVRNAVNHVEQMIAALKILRAAADACPTQPGDPYNIEAAQAISELREILKEV